MDDEFLKIVKGVWAVAAPVLGGGGVWAYLSTKRKASSPSEVATSQAAIADAIAEHMKILLSAHTADQDDLRKTVLKQGKKINALVKKVSVCSIQHARCETELAEVRSEIARLSRETALATINPEALPLKEKIHAAD